MSVLGNFAKSIFIPAGESEKFTFKKYDGKLLKQYVSGGGTYPPSKIQRVTLKINPTEVSHDQPRLTQKVQTNIPERFVIFDWGVDLHVMNIRGVTGNLLPDIMQNSLDPMKPVSDFASSLGTNFGLSNDMKKGLSAGLEVMLANMSYFEILNMSQKYRTFVKLQDLYLEFDADTDVCTLEFGEFIYRIFFVNFNFVQEANSPWNWQYTIVLNVLTDLGKFKRKGDGSFNSNSLVDAKN